jgi:hypothetical protein
MPLIVTPRQLVQRSELYSQLASLLSAGVALVQALELIQRKPPSHSYRQPLGAIIDNIHAGASFADSLTSLGRWIPSFDLALIQAAEQSGRLAESMRLLADLSAARPISAQFHGASGLSLLPGHLALVVFRAITPAACLEGQVPIPAAEINGLRSALRRRVPLILRHKDGTAKRGDR